MQQKIFDKFTFYYINGFDKQSVINILNNPEDEKFADLLIQEKLGLEKFLEEKSKIQSTNSNII